MKRAQKGITLVGFIMVLAVVGVFAYMGMKFFAVKDAANGVAKESGITEMDASKVEDLFFRRLDVSYADSVKRDNVKVVRKDAGYVMTIEYEVRKPLIANLDVVGRFDLTQEIKRGGGD